MVRQSGQVQAGVQILACVVDAVLLPDLAALQGYRRAQLGHGDGLHAAGTDEVDHGAAEQGGQVQVAVVQDVDAAVVGIAAGVVVDVHAGEDVPSAHDVDDLCIRSCSGVGGDSQPGQTRL